MHAFQCQFLTLDRCIRLTTVLAIFQNGMEYLAAHRRFGMICSPPTASEPTINDNKHS